MSGFRFILVLLAIIAAFLGAGYLATRGHQAGWDSPTAIGQSMGAMLRGDAAADEATRKLVTNADDGSIGAFAQDTGQAGGEWLRNWGGGIDAGAPAELEPTLPQTVARDVGKWLGNVPDTEPVPPTTAVTVTEGTATAEATDEPAAATDGTAAKPADTTVATVPSAGSTAGGADAVTTVVPIPPATTDPDTAATIAPAFTELHFDQPSGPIIAGTAGKGAQVSVTVDEAVIGTGIADDQGEWTVLPRMPVVPGEHWIGVTARAAAGASEEIAGERRLVLVPVPTAQATAGSGTGEVAVGDKTSVEAAGVGQDGGTGTAVALGEDMASGTTTSETQDSAAEPGATSDPATTQVVAPVPASGGEPAASGTGSPAPSATPETAAPTAQEYAQASEMEKEADKYWDWDTWFGGDGTKDQPGGQMPPAPPATDTGGTSEGALATLPDDKISISGVRYTPVGSKKGLVTLSGRGLVGSKVRLHIDEDPLGEVDVAENGRWLQESQYWIAPGAHAARAALIGKDGTIVAEAAYPFSREVPAQGQESTIVATAPEPSVATAGAAAHAEPLAFSDVRYEAQAGGGRITASGRGTAGAAVTLQVDGKPAGASKVAENGRWLIEQPIELPLGEHEAAVEAVDATGMVLGTVTFPFVAEASPTNTASTTDADDQQVATLEEPKAPESATGESSPEPAATGNGSATSKPTVAAKQSMAKASARAKTRSAAARRAKAKAKAAKSAQRKKAARLAKASKTRTRSKVAARAKRKRLVQVYVRRGNTIELIQVPAGFVKSTGVLRLKGHKSRHGKVVARKQNGAWIWLKGRRKSFIAGGKQNRRAKRVIVYSCQTNAVCTARRVRLR